MAAARRKNVTQRHGGTGCASVFAISVSNPGHAAPTDVRAQRGPPQRSPKRGAVHMHACHTHPNCGAVQHMTGETQVPMHGVGGATYMQQRRGPTAAPSGTQTGGAEGKREAKRGTDREGGYLHSHTCNAPSDGRYSCPMHTRGTGREGGGWGACCCTGGAAPTEAWGVEPKSYAFRHPRWAGTKRGPETMSDARF